MGVLAPVDDEGDCSFPEDDLLSGDASISPANQQDDKSHATAAATPGSRSNASMGAVGSSINGSAPPSTTSRQGRKRGSTLAALTGNASDGTNNTEFGANSNVNSDSALPPSPANSRGTPKKTKICTSTTSYDFLRSPNSNLQLAGNVDGNASSPALGDSNTSSSSAANTLTGNFAFSPNAKQLHRLKNLENFECGENGESVLPRAQADVSEDAQLI